METAAYFAFYFLPAAAIALLLVGSFGFTIDHIKEACCARCRYSVAGLPDSPEAVCPECGQPLAGRGTRKPGARVLRRARPNGLWFGLIPLALFVVISTAAIAFTISDPLDILALYVPAAGLVAQFVAAMMLADLTLHYPRTASLISTAAAILGLAGLTMLVFLFASQ